MALDEIKHLMAAGETAEVDEALKELLAKEPNNLQSKMLYGTCRQLLGGVRLWRSGAIRIRFRVSATSPRSSRASARSVPSAKSARLAAARWRSPRPVPSPKPHSASASWNRRRLSRRR